MILEAMPLAVGNTKDGVNFNFSNSESILLSPPGLFRMCFCRPGLAGSLESEK